MTYEEFVRNVLNEGVRNAGSVSALAKELGAKPNFIAKIIRGERVPSEKTFKKWYPQIHFVIKKVIEFYI